MANARSATQTFVANTAETSPISRKPARRRSMSDAVSCERRATRISAVVAATTCRTSSFGTKYRSRSNCL
jgi:hypothetical protein